MRRLTAAILLSLTALLSLVTAAHPGEAHAQEDARRRQAAAEAYDRGTAAYLDEEYSEAAQWFETANRMAPAAPALVQAIRSHQRAENFARAATLALQLQKDYSDDKASSEYAQSVLSDLAPQFVRVDVTCDQDCKLDLDGKLQEFPSFFLPPGTSHKLVATFNTGEAEPQTIEGEAGSSRSVEFIAPPPPPETPDPITSKPAPPSEELDRKPLAPLYTFIGAGLTGALAIGTVISGIDASAGAPDYDKAADKANAACAAGEPDCQSLYDAAQRLLKDGQSKETRTNILIGATAVVGVGTAVIAIFLTDWSSDHDAAEDTGEPEEASASFGFVPTRDGAFAFARGRF
jgi:hypothetical protein